MKSLFELRETADGFELFKTHYISGDGEVNEIHQPNSLKTWAERPNGYELSREKELNDWSRWNKALYPGQKVEISEYIYFDLLECLPPRKMIGNYFEVGEADHHDSEGRPIFRACWKEHDKFFTGYPKNINQPTI